MCIYFEKNRTASEYIVKILPDELSDIDDSFDLRESLIIKSKNKSIVLIR